MCSTSQSKSQGQAHLKKRNRFHSLIVSDMSIQELLAALFADNLPQNLTELVKSYSDISGALLPFSLTSLFLPRMWML